jgi:Putative Flp pilus-assembly TadE/G-like
MMAIAAVAMVSMLGAVSMVVDAGVYFVIQHQLQNAVDAAALDAVWFSPACFGTLPDWVAAGCQAHNPLTPPAGCSGDNAAPCTAAWDEARANWGIAVSLCNGPKSTPGNNVQLAAGPGLPPPETLNVPTVTPYVVTLSCDAPHWFARVLPGVNATMHISASASAALGWLGPNGQLIGGPQPDPSSRLVARLLI